MPGVRRRDRVAALSLIVAALLPFGGQAVPADAGAANAERLLIRYHSGTFELVSRKTIKKVLPPTFVFADTTVPHSGSWFELQTTTGRNVYRRLMQSPQTIYYEMIPDSLTGKIVRQETTVSDRTFVLLVPMREDAVQVAFFGPPADAAAKRAATQLLGTIRLR